MKLCNEMHNKAQVLKCCGHLYTFPESFKLAQVVHQMH